MVENKENSCEISTAAICFTEILFLRKKIPLLPGVYKAKLWDKDWDKDWGKKWGTKEMCHMVKMMNRLR